MKHILTAILLAISLNVHAQYVEPTPEEPKISIFKDSDTWTKTELEKEAAVVALLFIDMQQTKDIANHHSMFETNPIMGRHPSNRKINEYFGAILVSEIIASDILPTKYRNELLDGTITLEVIVTGHNNFIGLHFHF